MSKSPTFIQGYDTVLDKGLRLGARRHKSIYNYFSIGDPLKIMVLEFTTNLVDLSYLGCPIFNKKMFNKIKHAKKLRIISFFWNAKVLKYWDAEIMKR